MHNRIKRSEIPKIKEQLLIKQKNLCLVCKRDLSEMESKFKHLHHIHETGNIVGVLCVNCNQFEGRVLNWFKRTGLMKTEIEIIDILKGLINMYRKKPTDYIHPTFLSDEEKRVKRNARARRQRRRRK